MPTLLLGPLGALWTRAMALQTGTRLHATALRFVSASSEDTTLSPPSNENSASKDTSPSADTSTPTASDLIGVPESFYAQLPETVQRALLAEYAPAENWQKWRERSALKAFQRHELDTGSSEVQIAIMTARIANLTRHLRNHRKDIRTQRSLEYIVAQRRKLLRYLFRTEPERYEETVERLGIRAGSLMDPSAERRARRPGDLRIPTGSKTEPISRGAATTARRL